MTKLVGLSGCTNGGKTTLAKRLLKEFKNSAYLSQDDFYFPRDGKHLSYISELESFNFDVITAINMDKLRQELEKLVDSGKYDFIFLDGFLLYDDEKLYNMLDYKYFLFLTKEECLRRRQSRNYKTIDTPNYFDKCVWIEFLKYKQKCENIYNDIIYLNGYNNLEDLFQLVSKHLLSSNIIQN